MTIVSSQVNCILDHCRKGSLKVLRLLLLGAIISTNVFLYINHTQVSHIRAKIYYYHYIPFNFSSILWKHGSDLNT